MIILLLEIALLNTWSTQSNKCTVSWECMGKYGNSIHSKWKHRRERNQNERLWNISLIGKSLFPSNTRCEVKSTPCHLFHWCLCYLLQHALFESRLTSTNATVRTRSIFDSGKRASTCGDIPISIQLVTTDITLIVSKANWNKTQIYLQLWSLPLTY